MTPGEQLMHEHPRLFANGSADVGFPRGWLPLLKKTCIQLEELLNDQDIDHFKDFRVQQIKEKYGELRFYYSFCPEPTYEGINLVELVDSVIDQAETLSRTICQDCGGRGYLRKTGWMRTTCGCRD